MAYDETLADRVRQLLQAQPGLREIEMFGGLVFMVREHMTAGVRRGDLLARVGEEAGATALEEDGVEPMVFNRGPSASFVVVSPEKLRTRRQLERWLRMCLAFTATLPDREPGRRRSRGRM